MRKAASEGEGAVVCAGPAAHHLLGREPVLYRIALVDCIEQVDNRRQLCFCRFTEVKYSY